MSTDWKDALTRESILALLTDAEVAKVSNAEGQARLVDGNDPAIVKDQPMNQEDLARSFSIKRPGILTQPDQMALPSGNIW